MTPTPPNASNPQLTLLSNELGATLASQQIRHFRLREELAQVSHEIERLQASIAAAKAAEERIGGALQASTASPVAQQAATQRPTLADEFKQIPPMAAGVQEAEAKAYVDMHHAEAKAKPAAEPAPKAKRTRKRGGPVQLTAAGKRRGRPPGSRNRDKPAAATKGAVSAQQASDAADEAEQHFTPQQRANMQTAAAARQAMNQAAVN